MAYTPIKTNNLEDVKLSYTTKQTFDILNNNAGELDDRADKADAKFEAIEPIVENAVTYTAQAGKTDAQKTQARTNIGAGTYSKPSGGIPASDLAESYYLASNPNGYTNNQGTVTSVGAGAGLSISGTATVNPTVNVASDRKLLTTTEYNTINTNIGTAQSTADGAVEDAAAAQQKADDAYALAEGRENATSYANYQAMVAALNAESSATLKVGDNIYIETVGVPDLWVSGVLDSKASYTYTTDQAIVDALNNPSIGYVNIGWYRLDELETAKVDLSGYVKKTTTVTGTGALGGGGALSQNRTITHNAGSAPNVASGLYKISTDAYSHVSGATAVATLDLTPLLDGSYLAKANPTGTGALSLNREANSTVGHNSTTLGSNNRASGSASYAGGISTIASRQAQHVFGRANKEDVTGSDGNDVGSYIEIVGNGTINGADVTRSNARTLDWSGNEWLAGNLQFKSNSTNYKTIIQPANLYSASANVTLTLPSTTGVLALESQVPDVSGFMAKNNPTGTGSLSLNRSSALTVGTKSVAVNDNNVADGLYSFACGSNNHSDGQASFAAGQHTNSTNKSQFVFGEYNKYDPNAANASQRGTYMEIVGNGDTTNGLSNARTLDWSGNETLAGNIKLGNHTTIANNSSSDITVTLPSSAGTLATETYVDNAVGAIDQKQSFTFTASDARWSSTLVDGVYTLTFNASNTAGFVAGKIPLSCFNGNNEQVMATLGFTSTTVYIKSDTKFAGTIYVI